MSSPTAGRGSLGVLFGIVVLDLVGFGILIPQLGVYGVKFGASPLTVGLLVAVYSLMQLIFAPVLGRLSDRYGRRPVLLVSLAGSLAGYVLFAFAGSLPLLFLSRIVDGISGGNISTAQAYVADVTTPEKRARGMGLIGAAFGLGFTLGPAVGGLLGAWGGNLAIGLFAAGLSGLNLLLGLWLLPESRTGASAPAPSRSMRAAPDVLRLPIVGLCLVLFLLFTLAFAQMEGTFSVFLLSRFLATGPVPLEGGLFTLNATADEALLSEASLRTGYLFVLVGVVSALIQGGLWRRISRRFATRAPGGSGESRVAVLGFGFTALGLALLPVAPSYGWLFGVMALLAIGSALVSPVLSALVSLHAPQDRMGGTLGVYQSFGSLGRILGPALGGLLFTRAGPLVCYGAAAALLCVGGVLGLVLTQQVRLARTPLAQTP